MLERLLSPVTRRFAWARTALAVNARFGAVQGGAMASSITLSAFLSIFPLLLVGIAVVGVVAGRVDVAGKVIDQLSLTGDAADIVHSTLDTAKGTQKAASIIGLGGLLWGGLGLVGTIELGFGAAWQHEGRGLKGKGIGMVWLVGAGVLLAGSFAATAASGFLPGPLTFLTLVPTLAVDVALWLWTLAAITPRPHLGWRDHLPGAVLGGVGFEALKLVGTVYVPRLVGSSSALYGSLGVVFALLAWLALFGRLTLYAACLNVVRYEEEHGTVVVEVEVPRVPGEVPVTATRSGRALPST